MKPIVYVPVNGCIIRILLNDGFLPMSMRNDCIEKGSCVAKSE